MTSQGDRCRPYEKVAGHAGAEAAAVSVAAVRGGTARA